MFTIRRAQLEQLALDAARRERAAILETLRANGYHASDDAATGRITLHDKAGGKAWMDGIPGGLLVTSPAADPSEPSRTYRFRYNANRQVSDVTDPEGLRVVFDYDRRRRLAAIHRGTYGRFAFTYDALDRVTSIRYPDGTLSRIDYNLANRLSETVDRNGNTRRFDYTASGLLTRMTGPQGEVVAVEYTPQGQLAAVTRPGGQRHTIATENAADLSTTRFQLQQKPGAEPRDVVTVLSNRQLNLREYRYPDGTFAIFRYQGKFLVSAENAECTVKLKYDASGALEAEETIFPGEAAPYVVRYRRNLLGRVIAIETSSGTCLHYTRDAEQRLRTVSWAPNATWKIAYAASGAISTILYPNGAVLERGSTPMGYLESLQLRSSTGPVLQAFEWSYDLCDRVIRESSNRATLHYSYDPEGRLQAVQTEGANPARQPLQLDPNGNPRLLHGQPCTYGPDDQLQQLGATRFAYDALGNLSHGLCPRGPIQCVHNGRGQLTQADVAGASTRYAYDAFGRRIRKSGPGGTTHFHWAGQLLVGETEERAGKKTQRDYAIVPELGVALAQRVNAWTHHIHHGRRLEPFAMTDSLGVLVWRADWDALGTAHIDPASRSALALRLPGQYFDSETGLHYNLARYYDPSTARFLERDPLGPQGGSWNEYLYGNGDPLNRSDPTGEFLPLLAAAAVGAVVGGAIGAGVEAYQEHESGKALDPWKIARAAAIGGAAGTVGALAAVGAGALLAPAAAALMETAAAGGAVATAAASVASYFGIAGGTGAAGGAAATCAQSMLQGQLPTAQSLLSGAKTGAELGILTAGVSSVAGRALPLLRPAVTDAGGELASTAKGAGERQGQLEGEPVDAVTGEVVSSTVDFTLPGALSLTLKRTYLSGLRQSGCFGPGWASTFGQSVTVDGSHATWFGDDGQWVRFDLASRPKDKDGWLANESSPGTLLRRIDAGFEVIDPVRTLFRFRNSAGARWLLTGIEDPNGNWIRLDWNAGSLRQIDHSGGYRLAVEATPDRLHRILFVEPGVAPRELIRYVYDPRGRLIEAVDATGLPFRYTCDDNDRIVRWEDRRGTWCEYRFDSEGRCIHSFGPGRLYDYRFEYDPPARTTAVTNSFGQVKRYRCNARQQPVEIADARGFVTRIGWDRARKLSQTDEAGRGLQWQFSPAGQLTQIRDALGRTTRIAYGPHGLPEQLIDAAGNLWTRTYDPRGNLIAAAGPDGAVWKYERDPAGNILRAIDPEGFTRHFTCDKRGLVVSLTDARGNRTEFTRDAMGRVTSRRDPLNRLTRYAYDALGKLAEVEMPDHSRLRMEYDPEGNLTRRIRPDGSVYKYTYGPFDLLQEIENPSGAKYKFTYDTEARLTSVENNGRTWTYEYNATGQVVRETDFHGRTQRFDYDASGLCIRRVNGLGEEIELERDLAGQIVNRTGDTSARFEYDPMGQLSAAVNRETVELAFERDAYGRVLREIQNGRAVESVYNRRGLRVKRSVAGSDSEWQWDENGQLAALRLAGQDALHFHYDAAGREIERQMDGGLVLTQRFDDLDRLAGQQVRRRSAAPKGLSIVDRKYTFNANGDPIEIDDRRWGITRYTYDPDGRVADAQRSGGGTEGYKYDLAGNIASVRPLASQPPRQSGLATAKIAFSLRSFGKDGRLLKDRQAQYRWDADGRLQEKVQDGRRWRYRWTPEGRLDSVETPTGRWTYEYDALGRRVAKIGPAGKTEFLWDGPVVTEEKTSAAPAVEWFFTPGSFAPLARRQGAASSFCVTDQVGTPTELLDPTGTPTWSARLSLWGETESPPQQFCPIRFQGQWFDHETGLHYNFQRYYDPAAAMYLSADPIGLAGGPHPYAYVQNPLSWVDPFGLASCSATGQPTDKPLDWSRVGRTGKTADQHIIEHHSTNRPTKGTQGVFHDDPVATVEDAWSIAGKNKIAPANDGYADIYVVPRPNSGYAGGKTGDLGNLDHISIFTEQGTSKVITAYPSNGQLPAPKSGGP